MFCLIGLRDGGPFNLGKLGQLLPYPFCQNFKYMYASLALAADRAHLVRPFCLFLAVRYLYYSIKNCTNVMPRP